MVQVVVHAPMEPPEPDVPTEDQMPDEALDQVGHPHIPEDSVEKQSEVPEPLQVPIVTPQSRPMVPEQPLPQVLPMPRLMPLPDMLPKVPDQPVPYQGLINPRPLDIRLLSILPGYDNDIDNENNQKYSSDNLTR